MRPLVSTIIPAHNGQRTVRQAIESALAQTGVRGGLEVIVVDDGSTDSTSAILAEYGARIRSVRQTNSGVSAAINRGVSESRAEFVAFLHDDDYWLPGKLQAVLNAFDSDPRAGLVFSNYRTVDRDDGHLLGDVTFAHAPSLEEMFRILECVGPPSGVTMRRQLFDTCHGFDRRLTWGEDIDLWLRARQSALFALVPQTLWTYRKRTRLDVHDLRYPLAMRTAFEHVMREHFGPRARRLIAHTRDERAAILLALGLGQLDAGDRRAAIRTFTELMRYRPTYPIRKLSPSRLFSIRNLRRLFG